MAPVCLVAQSTNPAVISCKVVVDATADAEFHAAAGQLLEDVAGVGHRPCEAVEFGHDQGVALAAGCEGLTEPGAVAVATDKPVVELHPVGGDAQRSEGFLWAVRSCRSVEHRA